jgi:hypothetical protein
MARRKYRRDRIGRFSKHGTAGRQLRSGARRGAGAGALGLTALPFALSPASSATGAALAGASIQGLAIGGPAGALAGAGVAGGVYLVRRRRKRR